MTSLGARAGFTLIEVIVGLAVSSVVIAAAFGTLGLVRSQGLALEEANRAALTNATRRAMLVDWLAGARYQADVGGFQGIDSGTTGTPADEIAFPTMTRTPLGNGISMVRLLIDRDPETPEAGLVAEFVGAALSVPPRRMEIEPAVEGMEIRYLPEADGATEWVDGWIGRDQLPRGVEIVLLAAEGAELPPLLALPIRVALASAR